MIIWDNRRIDMIDSKKPDLGNFTLEDVAKKVTSFQKVAANKVAQVFKRILTKSDGEVEKKSCCCDCECSKNCKK